MPFKMYLLAYANKKDLDKAGALAWPYYSFPCLVRRSRKPDGSVETKNEGCGQLHKCAGYSECGLFAHKAAFPYSSSQMTQHAKWLIYTESRKVTHITQDLCLMHVYVILQNLFRMLLYTVCAVAVWLNWKLGNRH